MTITRRWSLPWKWNQAARRWEAHAYTIVKVRRGWDLSFRDELLGAHAYETVEDAMSAADRHRGITTERTP